jgi:hypothetical protein
MSEKQEIFLARFPSRGESFLTVFTIYDLTFSAEVTGPTNPCLLLFFSLITEIIPKYFFNSQDDFLISSPLHFINKFVREVGTEGIEPPPSALEADILNHYTTHPFHPI